MTNACPEGWSLKLLDEVALRGSGHTPDRKVASYWNGGIKWVSLADSDKLDRVSIGETEFQISEDGIANSSAVKHPAGAVIVSRDAGVGKSAVTTDEMAVSQHFIAWMCGPELHNYYLYYWLQNSKPQLERIAVGSTIKTIGLPFFQRLRIPLPPEAEQEKIAEVLLCWDRAIRLLDALLLARSKRKCGLMQQLLTGRKRFREFVTSTKKVNTRYGCFPADWAAVQIEDVANEISSKNDGGRELPVLSCTKHRGLVNSLEYFGKRIFSADTSNYKVVRRGDFAYATNHIEEGSIGYQDLHDTALISPMYTVFRTRAGVDHSFFFKLVKTELYRHIFEVNTSGSIARRGGLRWGEFAIIKVFLPSVPEQKRIAAVLEACDREIDLLQQQLEALKVQKRGLMHKLLTGEVRVKA